MRRLTLVVWFQVLVSILWLLIGAATGLFTTLEGAKESVWTGGYPVIWVIWVLTWSYTGYWAFATGNKLWMIMVRSRTRPLSVPSPPRFALLPLLRASPARSASTTTRYSPSLALPPSRSTTSSKSGTSS